jgi:hypothetical protein
MCPQGMIDKTTPLKAVPTAPRRPDLQIEAVGHPPFDKVAAAISTARIWFRSLNTAFTASDLIAASDLMLAVEREWAATSVQPGPSASGDTPAPEIKPKQASAARKRIRPKTSLKGEPTP